MGGAGRERESLWTPKVLVNYLWTVAIGLFAVAATFLVEESRSAFFMIQFREPGDPTTVLGSILQYRLPKLGPVLLWSLPFISAAAALSLVLYEICTRGRDKHESLKRRLTLGWLPVLALWFLIPDGIYFLAPMWAISVVPASADLYPKLRWRLAECAVFGVIACLAWYYPLT